MICSSYLIRKLNEHKDVAGIEEICMSRNGWEMNSRLPSLMWQHPNFAKLTIFNMLFAYIFLRTTLDREFRLKTFIDGAKQAMLVISNALGAQDYKELESLVHERTIKLLKSRVSSLNPNQRKLISIEKDKFICIPGGIFIRNKDNMKVVEIATLGLYIQGDINFIMPPPEGIAFANYIFQRTYVHNGSWIGGPWTVKSITHFS
ncbi:hypothetical protein ANTQUA_LOCUS4255 [Anthophora quadrimaculata]